jgi:HEAT repeat protein
VLVAAAAKIVASAELEGFEPALCAAFERFMQQPVKKDPGCNAKANVVRALYGLSARAFDVFLRGIQHVQREPVWGGSVDTAIELRALCGLGLVRGDYPDALIELAELLADPEPMARLAAAQAVAYSERADIGLPLLRLKARLGDAEARVTGACLAGLLALAPHASLPFVERFLGAEDVAVREATLLALGESRLPAALPLLQRASEDTLASESRAVALMAIALMRSDTAWEYLLSLVRDASDGRARAAIDALATYRHEPSLRARTLSAVATRSERSLLEHAEHAFHLSE